MLDERWVFHENAEAVQAGQGVVRRVLAYSKDLMCVENTFEKGAVGSLHHHPHTQITYVVSGEFEFDIEGEKKIVKAGDTMLKLNGVSSWISLTPCVRILCKSVNGMAGSSSVWFREMGILMR